MKKLIIFILFISVCLSSKAQDLPYKSLSEFGKDTTAFIIYNFMDRADYYKGKTIKEVTRDLGLPVKDYIKDFSARGNYFTGISIYIYNRIVVERLINNEQDYNAIDIYWETPIRTDNSQFKNFQRGTPWDKGGYDYVKDLRIKEVRVGILEYSKYYDKYKPKKTKSQQSRFIITNGTDGFFTITRPTCNGK